MTNAAHCGLQPRVVARADVGRRDEQGAGEQGGGGRASADGEPADPAGGEDERAIDQVGLAGDPDNVADIEVSVDTANAETGEGGGDLGVGAVDGDRAGVIADLETPSSCLYIFGGARFTLPTLRSPLALFLFSCVSCVSWSISYIPSCFPSFYCPKMTF